MGLAAAVAAGLGAAGGGCQGWQGTWPVPVTIHPACVWWPCSISCSSSGNNKAKSLPLLLVCFVCTLGRLSVMNSYHQ